jgi:hypothetical protein
MSLREELPRQLLAFAEGRIEERALFAWLGGAGRYIGQEDLQTREIWKTAVSLLSEVAGHPHDVSAVRSDIASLLDMATRQRVTVQSPEALRFAHEVLDQIRCYIDGVITAEDLSSWLDAHAQQIHDSESLELRGLADLAFSLLDEALQGARTDESARRSLVAAMPIQQRFMHSVS